MASDIVKDFLNVVAIPIESARAGKWYELEPFSISVMISWVDRYGRKRENKTASLTHCSGACSAACSGALFNGDIYLSGVSLRRKLEMEYNINCGMVQGTYQAMSNCDNALRMTDDGWTTDRPAGQDESSDLISIEVWFSSQRTTVNLVGVQAMGPLALINIEICVSSMNEFYKKH